MKDKKLPLVGFNNPILNALDALEEGDFDQFQQALNVGVNFNVRVGNPMRIFEKALGTPGRAKYVKECLDRGCKPNYINTDLKKAAINFAIDSHDPEILTELLRHSNEKFDIDHKYQKLTPLNSLSKNLTAQNVTNVVACMELLLSHNASANIPDQDKRKPLDQVLSHYSELDENMKYEILRLFVENVKNEIIYNNFEVCSVLERDYPELVLIKISRYHENYLTNPNRSNSIQHALFNNIKIKNIKAFRDILLNAADPLHLLLYKQEDFNPFEEALQTYGCIEIVATCLKYGCKADYINEGRNETAINYAVKSCDPKIIDLLLSESNIPVNHKGSSYFFPNNSTQLVTPLYALAELLCKNDVEPDFRDNIKACIELLLKYGASPDIPNTHRMTPLLFVLKMRELDKETKHEFVKLLLDYDAHTDIYRGDEILHILQRDYPDLEPPITSDEIKYETLLEHLRSGNELRFVHLFQRFKVNSTKLQEVQKGELFLNAIDLRRYSALDELLQSDQPLKHTVSEDSSELFSSLLFQCITEIGLGTEASSKFQGLKKCILLLLKSKRFDINKFAFLSMVPLKIALEFSSDFVIKELLKHGAYIGRLNSDEFNNFPIGLLEEHFNNCITSNEVDWNNINFQIFINYKNLLTNKPQPVNNNKMQKTEDNKGVRIPMDTKNLFTTEDRIGIEAADKDMTAITLIANSSNHRHLLQHPLITSYLFVKWHRYSRLFYFNFIFYLLFTISFITHEILKFHESENQAATAVFGVLSWIGIVYLVVRGLIQFIMATKIYVHSNASWIELCLIFFLIMTYNVQDQNIQRGISAIAIMLIALNLCLLVGSLPNLFISTHMMILRAVCRSTLKILSLFSIFIFMFSVCFYLAFSKPMINENASDIKVPAVKFSDFPNLLDSIIKTFGMFTGELGTNFLNFNTGFSYVIYLVFVIFMPIVLLNLLNGLAVYDTQAIKAQAELNAAIYLANLLISYEIVLTEQSRFITFLKKNDRTRAMYYRLLNICLNNTTTDKIAILPNNRNKLKTSIIKNPMLAGILYVPLKNETCLKKLLRFTFKRSEMDGRTVKSAMAVIKQKAQAELERQEVNERKRRNELQQQEMKNKEKKFESELQTVKETLFEVLKVLQDIKGMNVKETETNKDKMESELQI